MCEAMASGGVWGSRPNGGAFSPKYAERDRTSRCLICAHVSTAPERKLAKEGSALGCGWRRAAMASNP